jgi:hypothetical protein
MASGKRIIRNNIMSLFMPALRKQAMRSMRQHYAVSKKRISKEVDAFPIRRRRRTFASVLMVMRNKTSRAEPNQIKRYSPHLSTLKEAQQMKQPCEIGADHDVSPTMPDSDLVRQLWLSGERHQLSGNLWRPHKEGGDAGDLREKTVFCASPGRVKGGPPRAVRQRRSLDIVDLNILSASVASSLIFTVAILVELETAVAILVWPKGIGLVDLGGVREFAVGFA